MQDVNDLQEQISDLKHMLRAVMNALRKHMPGDDLSYPEGPTLIQLLAVAQRTHHEFCTERSRRRAREARAIIDKASGEEGGPTIADLEAKSGVIVHCARDHRAPEEKR